MQFIGEALGKIFSWLFNLLPDSFVRTFLNTYSADIEEFKSYAGVVAYFLPIDDMVTMTGIWAGVMGAMFIFYAIKNRL